MFPHFGNVSIILFQLIFQIIIKKREPLNFGIPDGSTGFSSRLAATQDMPFIHQSVSILIVSRQELFFFISVFFKEKEKN